MAKGGKKYNVTSLDQEKSANATKSGNDIRDKKPLPGDVTEPPQRSFLERNAFIICLLLNTMIEGLGASVSSQFKYRFFHQMFSDQLRHLNASRNSVCGVDVSHVDPAAKAVEDDISAETARWGLYGHYVSVLPMFVSSVILGMKSDQIGRRFCMLLPFLSSFITYIILAVVIRMELHYGYTLIGTFLSHLTGGRIGMIFAGYAIISDSHGKKKSLPPPSSSSSSTTITTNSANGNSGSIPTITIGKDNKTVQSKDNEKPPLEKPEHVQEEEYDDNELDLSREKQRTWKIVALDVCHRMASGIVAFATGYVIQYAGFFYSIVMVLGVKLCVFVFAYIFITETGRQKKNVGFLAPLRIIYGAFKDPKKTMSLCFCFFGIFFAVLGIVDEMEIMHTYEMSPPFCLDAVQLGWLSSVSRVKTLFSMPMLWLYKRIGLGEAAIASLGMIFYSGGAFVLSSIRKLWVLFVFPFITIPGGLSTTMAKAIISRHIGRAALASTFAVMLAGEEVFMFGGSIGANYMYQKFVYTLPTAPFYLAASAFLVASLLFGLEALRHHRSGDVVHAADHEATVTANETKGTTQS